MHSRRVVRSPRGNRNFGQAALAGPKRGSRKRERERRSTNLISPNGISGPGQFPSAPRLRLKQQSQCDLTPSVNTSRLIGRLFLIFRVKESETPWRLVSLREGQRWAAPLEQVSVTDSPSWRSPA